MPPLPAAPDTRAIPVTNQGLTMKPVAKAADAFRTISEVSDDLDVPKHVLRFWELKFTQIKPMKRGGGRRYYRPQDLELLRGIHKLLHNAGYTIRGVQKILREQGVDAVKALAGGAHVAPPAGAELPAPILAPAARRSDGNERLAGFAAPGAGVHGRAAQIQSVIAELELCLALAKTPAAAAAPVRKAIAKRG